MPIPPIASKYAYLVIADGGPHAARIGHNRLPIRQGGQMRHVHRHLFPQTRPGIQRGEQGIDVYISQIVLLKRGRLYVQDRAAHDRLCCSRSRRMFECLSSRKD